MDRKSLETLFNNCEVAKISKINGIENRNHNKITGIIRLEPYTSTNKIKTILWLVYGLDDVRESNQVHSNELVAPPVLNPKSGNGIPSGKVKLELKFNSRRNELFPYELQLEPSFHLHYGSEMEGIVSKIQIFGNNRRQISSGWLHCRSDSSSSQYSCFPDGFARVDKPLDLSSYVIPKLKVQTPGFHATETYRKSIVMIVEFIRTQPVAPIKSTCKTCVPFGKLFNDKEFADVEIIVGKSGEEQTMMAHKAVLAARSSVFKAMLQSRMKENTESKIEITDLEADTFHELLKYLYTAEVDLGNYAVKLFKCSDKYDIKELNKECQDFIVQNIPSFKWAELFELIVTYGERFSFLTSGIKVYYERNAMTLKKEVDFQNAILAFPEVFVRLHCL